MSDASPSAGLSSAPEASDSTTSSKGFRGVVKAGFRNLGPFGFADDCWGVKKDLAGWAFDGVAKGLGREEALPFEGDAKPVARQELSAAIKSR